METRFLSGSQLASLDQSRIQQADFPESFRWLFDDVADDGKPVRYRTAHGGRGGAKSWNYARANIVLGCQRSRRVLCAREFQNSIADSVHKLIADQIRALNLGFYYEVLQNSIRGPNGTEFVFIGLRHNIWNMKSYEGFDVCWIEEAKDVSKQSWDVLIPTIRKEGSEIWSSFNPELDTDETYQRLVLKPPPGSIVRKVTWRDNPWFPAVLRQEMEYLKERDYDAYLNVWEGECRASVDGAVFASELLAAKVHNRVRGISYDPTKPVVTVWDLGQSDATAIWFVQFHGREKYIIDFYQANGQKFAHYAKVLRERPYAYGRMWLPHDAANEVQSAETSILQQARSHHFDARIVPRVAKSQLIEAGRTIFPSCWFDETKCADGLQSLRHWKYIKKPDGLSFSKEPEHTWASHASESFCYLGVAVKQDHEGAVQTTADGDYDPLAGAPTQESRRGRTVEHTDYDTLG